MEINRIAIIFLATFWLIGCGGNSGSDESTSAFEVSPGGIWQAEARSIQWESPLADDPLLDDLFEGTEFFYVDETESLPYNFSVESFDVFLIAENGKLVFLSAGAYLSSVVGFGKVTESNSEGIAGTYSTPRIDINTAIVSATQYSAECSFEGTVVERELLYLTTTCTYSNGIVEENTLNLMPVPDCSEGFCTNTDSQYETPSSLSNIAGDYELSPPFPAFDFEIEYAELLGFDVSSNEEQSESQISISSNGVISGQYGEGLNCDVNGELSVIDTDFNLYEIEWVLSNCEEGALNGAVYEGLATYMITEFTSGLNVMLSPTGSEASVSGGISALFTPTSP